MKQQDRGHGRAHLTRILLAAALGCLDGPALAQGAATSQALPAPDGATVIFDLPAQDLAISLRSVARQTRTPVLFVPEDVAGRVAPPLKAQLTATEALKRLLEGRSDLAFDATPGGPITVRKVGLSPSRDTPRTPALAERPAVRLIAIEEVVVTGSRIRGAPPSSQVISLSQQQMLDAGQFNLGDVVRNIPQSFGGGQNPTVAGGGNQGPGNENTTSGSSINLRGLGSDATLTLINGHRVAYDGVRQSVDVSAIPLAAIERLEINADGASAIYGSDAIGGVANIILKRDFDGVSTHARYGVSTAGGNRQQQYGVVGGLTWDSGGFMAVADYSRTQNITAADRDLTQKLNATTSLVPEIRQQNAFLTAHQALSDIVELSMDVSYNRRNSATLTASTRAQPYYVLGGRSHLGSEGVLASPKLSIALPHDWRVEIDGQYGNESAPITSWLYSAGVTTTRVPVAYRNTLRSAGVGADGSLFDLPAGPAKLALGVGYHEIGLSARAAAITATSYTQTLNYDARLRDSFAYAELFVPIVDPKQNLAFVDRLSFTAAGRYENYPGVDRIATPKLGLVYAPVPDFDLKASWGKSFKAPTLYQAYQPTSVRLAAASTFGAVGFPATTTALYISGGRPSLQPERATSWSVTGDLHPRLVPGLRIQASYFNVDYRDRVLAPITSSGTVLRNDIYATLITRGLGTAALNNVIGLATTGLTTNGLTYDPANVYAVIDNRQTNVARQKVDGVDLSGNYQLDLAAGGSVALSASATYIRSKQLYLPGQPYAQLAGTIYDPPHWRSRAGATWSKDDITIASFVNYTGSVIDNRTADIYRINSMLTLDAIVRYQLAAGGGWLSGTEISLSALNLTDRKPSASRQSTDTDVPYDSNNYPIAGRVVAVSISKRW